MPDLKTPRDIQGEAGECEDILVYALAQAACAGIVVHVLFDFRGPVACTYVEL